MYLVFFSMLFTAVAIVSHSRCFVKCIGSDVIGHLFLYSLFVNQVSMYCSELHK